MQEGTRFRFSQEGVWMTGWTMLAIWATLAAIAFGLVVLVFGAIWPAAPDWVSAAGGIIFGIPVAASLPVCQCVRELQRNALADRRMARIGR